MNTQDVTNGTTLNSLQLYDQVMSRIEPALCLDQLDETKARCLRAKPEELAERGARYHRALLECQSEMRRDISNRIANQRDVHAMVMKLLEGVVEHADKKAMSHLLDRISFQS